MTRPLRTGVLLRQAATHPLGRLTLAGLHVGYRAAAPMPGRFWDTFAAVYVLGGRAEFRDVAGISRPLRRGDLLLTFPGHGYHYRIDPRSAWSEFYLQFQGPIFDTWLQQQTIAPARPIVHLRPVDRWLDRFLQIARFRPHRCAGDVLRQLCQLQTLLADVLAQGRDRKKERPRTQWLTQASALLDRQPIASPPDWTSLAAEMGLSYDRSRKRFVHAAGVSPAKYLVARRLETACTMLHDRKLGLKEIARLCVSALQGHP